MELLQSSRAASRLAWGLWAVSMLVLAGAVALSPNVLAWEFGDVFSLPVGVAFVTVGSFLGSRRPRNPIGWLFLAWGFVMISTTLASSYIQHGASGSLPGVEWAGWAVAVVWHPSFALLAFMLLLFPHGRLPSPRWRRFAQLAVAVYALLALSAALSPSAVELYYPGLGPALRLPGHEVADAVFGVLLPAQLGLVAAAMVSLALKLRRARGLERQQIKWFVYTVVVVVLAFIAGVIVLGAGYLFPLFAAIPLAAGLAILRHRLYDIDRVVNRTLVYGLLTALLAGAYTGLALLLGLVFGRSSSLAVAGATLAVAALFQPLRRRVQHTVDRRFDRRRYDAARTIDGFSARLRQQVDLASLRGELLEVVEQTMQPTKISLWLRAPDAARNDAGTLVGYNPVGGST